MGRLPALLRVLAITAAWVGLYTWLGFLVSMWLLLFGLTFAVERKPILSAALFGAGVDGASPTASCV
jgi:hypothetical protein